ncbi:MAG: hypothetical protein NTY38_25385 [Acidobacteria bacterium]|nr:hypothetical protein [Acidobacteriota bacterium]
MILPIAKNTVDRWFTVGLFGAWVLIAVIQRPGWPSRMSRHFYLIPLWVTYASYQVMATGADLRIVGGYVLFLVPALVFDYYREDSRTLMILTVAGILTFLGGSFQSIGVLLVNPMAARQASTGMVQFRQLATSGVGSYPFAYGVALLLPFFVAISVGAGRTLRLRVASLACACVFAYYSYLATFALALCIMIAGTLLALLHRIRQRPMRFVAFGAIILAGSIYLAGFGAELMSSVSRSSDNQMLSIKTNELASLFSGTLTEAEFDRKRQTNSIFPASTRV